MQIEITGVFEWLLLVPAVWVLIYLFRHTNIGVCDERDWGEVERVLKLKIAFLEAENARLRKTPPRQH